MRISRRRQRICNRAVFIKDSYLSARELLLCCHQSPIAYAAKKRKKVPGVVRPLGTCWCTGSGLRRQYNHEARFYRTGCRQSNKFHGPPAGTHVVLAFWVLVLQVEGRIFLHVEPRQQSAPFHVMPSPKQPHSTLQYEKSGVGPDPGNLLGSGFRRRPRSRDGRWSDRPARRELVNHGFDE